MKGPIDRVSHLLSLHILLRFRLQIESTCLIQFLHDCIKQHQTSLALIMVASRAGRYRRFHDLSLESSTT